MDRFELGFAVTAMTGFVVLIAASVWLMVLPDLIASRGAPDD